MVDLALVQIAVRDGEAFEDRIARGVQMLKSQTRTVQMAMFPELWGVGFFGFDAYAASAQSLDGPVASALSDAARDLNIWLHGGSLVEQTTGGNLYNTSLLFDPSGNLRATYRKIHLFGYESRESRILTSGDAPSIVETDFGSVGLSTCYDLRFPELYRAYARAGVEVILVTSAWPFPRLEHWLTLSQARAIENLSWLVACNACGNQNGGTFTGNSVVYDPWGVPVARAGTSETVLYATVDTAKVKEVRERFPALSDSRPIGDPVRY